MKKLHGTNCVSDDVLIAFIEMLGKVLLACIAMCDQANHSSSKWPWNENKDSLSS